MPRFSFRGSVAELERGDKLLAGVLILVGAAITLLTTLNGPDTVTVTLAALGLAGAAIGVLLKVLHGRAQENEDQRAGWHLPPLRLREMLAEGLMYDLGVDSEAPESLEMLGLSPDEHPDYLRRRIDEELRRRLREAGKRDEATLIVVSGPSKAGKSRALLEACAKVLPDAWLISPKDAESVWKLARPRPPRGLGSGPCVIWVDDIEEVAQRDRGLNPDAIRSFGEWGRPVLVLATQGGKGVALSRDGRFREIVGDLLARHPPVPLDPALEGAEMELARAKHPAAAKRIARDGFGEFMIAAPRLIDRLRNGDSAAGRAIAWAAIDCRRAGLLRPLSVEQLKELYVHYLAGAPTPTSFTRGLEWAASPLYSAVALIDRSEGGTGNFAPHDYVVDWANRQGRPLHAAVWEKVMNHYAQGEDDLLRIASIANRNRDKARAEAAWKRADSLGSGRAAATLGRLLEERGDLEAAEAAYRRGDKRGDPHASGSLGLLLDKQGEHEAAAAALKRADAGGDPQGACWHGFFLQWRFEDMEGAEAAYRRAAARGHWHGSTQLGTVLEEKGELEAAETAFREADEHGDSSGARYHGHLLRRRGQLEEAEAAYRRADERGDGNGAARLGTILEGRGELAKAEAAFRRAHEREEIWGSCKLAAVLHGRGEPEKAEELYRHAHAGGEVTGAINLARILQRRGELDEAEKVLRDALEWSFYAPRALGRLLQARGDLDGAEAAFREAGARGDPFSQLCLGELLEAREEEEVAELAFARAEELAIANAKENDSDAMLTLGRLRLRQGDIDSAEATFRHAHELGELAATNWLGWLLAYQREQPRQGLTVFRRADERGSAYAANHVGMLVRAHGDSAEALPAFIRADERGHAEGAFHLAEALMADGGVPEYRQQAIEAYERARKRALYGGETKWVERASAALEKLAGPESR